MNIEDIKQWYFFYLVICTYIHFHLSWGLIHNLRILNLLIEKSKIQT